VKYNDIVNGVRKSVVYRMTIGDLELKYVNALMNDLIDRDRTIDPLGDMLAGDLTDVRREGVMFTKKSTKCYPPPSFTALVWLAAQAGESDEEAGEDLTPIKGRFSRYSVLVYKTNKGMGAIWDKKVLILTKEGVSVTQKYKKDNFPTVSVLPFKGMARVWKYIFSALIVSRMRCISETYGMLLLEGMLFVKLRGKYSKVPNGWGANSTEEWGVNSYLSLRNLVLCDQLVDRESLVEVAKLAGANDHFKILRFGAICLDNLIFAQRNCYTVRGHKMRMMGEWNVTSEEFFKSDWSTV
jgi:hypothetical protein